MKTRALWKYCLSVLVGCVVALALAQAHAANESNGGQQPLPVQEAPEIQIEEPVHDFGEVLEGTEVEHDFVVANTGNAVLQITRVRPG